jgi:hypothetical protein
MIQRKNGVSRTTGNDLKGMTPWASMEIVKLGKDLRESTKMGRIYKGIIQNSLLSTLVPSPLMRILKGISAVNPDPVPPILAQTVIHAVESISSLLLSALTLDSSGTAQHHLAATICSLFALQLALQQYSEMLRKYLPKLSPPTYDLFSVILPLNDSDSGSIGNRKGKIGNSKSKDSLNGMTLAVEDAINKLIIGYRDVLVTYSLPQIYAEILKKKLEER